MKLKKSTTAAGSKVKRSLADKVEVIRLITNEGVSAKDALAEVFQGTTTEAMVNHPHSIVHGYRAAIERLIAKGDAEVASLLTAADLVDED